MHYTGGRMVFNFTDMTKEVFPKWSGNFIIVMKGTLDFRVFATDMDSKPAKEMGRIKYMSFPQKQQPLKIVFTDSTVLEGTVGLLTDNWDDKTSHDFLDWLLYYGDCTEGLED